MTPRDLLDEVTMTSMRSRGIDKVEKSWQT